MRKRFILILLVLFGVSNIVSCSSPLADGEVTAMEPVTTEMAADANSIYYATKWAFDQCGYPSGPEDLTVGVLETKWVPAGAASHYIDSIAGKDYGSNGVYYKMIIRITPLANGHSKVRAQTNVNSIVKAVKTTGDKERQMLAKIREHSRGYNITVTNLGVEE